MDYDVHSGEKGRQLDKHQGTCSLVKARTFRSAMVAYNEILHEVITLRGVVERETVETSSRLYPLGVVRVVKAS